MSSLLQKQTQHLKSQLRVTLVLIVLQNLTLNVSDNIPRILYYGFEPDNLDIIPPVKLRIFEDDTVFENNSIGIVPNKFDGVYSVVGVTSDTYDYNIPFDSDTITSYGSTSATMKYHTSSLTAQGPIHTVNAA